MQEKLPVKHATLVFPVVGNRVLLALGKPDKKIGANRRTGYGGHIEGDEGPLKCVMRELAEESGGVTTSPEGLELVASIDFHNQKKDGTKFICNVQVFLMSRWYGEFKTTDEMREPAWYQKDKLPFQEMMASDPFWVPHILESNGKKFKVEVWYDGPGEDKLEKPVEIVEVMSID